MLMTVWASLIVENFLSEGSVEALIGPAPWVLGTGPLYMMLEARCSRPPYAQNLTFQWLSQRWWPLWGGPDVKGLANSIGIDWKGTQLPPKTDRADTLIFNLRAHPGGAVAI